MICFGAIVPHGNPVFEQPEGPTRAAMERLAERLRQSGAEAVPSISFVRAPNALEIRAESRASQGFHSAGACDGKLGLASDPPPQPASARPRGSAARAAQRRWRRCGERSGIGVFPSG